MIAVISTGFVFEGLVKYHSNKIESENSLIISSNLYANNLEEYQHRIENIADSYHGKNTKPVKHFILSLPPDEKLNEQKFAAASKEYLEKMGYDQTPYVTLLQTDEGVRVVGEIGLSGIYRPEDARPMVDWARACGMTVMMHIGGASIPGSSVLGAREALAILPDIASHTNGGPTAAPIADI